MNVRDLGEFGLIGRLRGAISGAAGERLIVGAGDDAAVWRNHDGYAIATTDTMVAGVHFLADRADWRDVGWKALATNISDIAAMGGTPAFALVTLSLPAETPVAAIDALYAGLRECAEAYEVTIAGGDIVAAPVVSITIALVGDAALAMDGSPLLLRRDAAVAGDVIAVSGALGGSAGGLRLLLEGGDASADAGRRLKARATEVHGTEQSLVRRHMRPLPRIDVGRAAIDAGLVCAIDISDGLVQDLGHICAASGLGAEITLAALPIDAALTATFPADAASMAATCGEDYELLVTGSADAIARASAGLDVPLSVIGRMVGGGAGVRILDANGDEVHLVSAGWDHLSRGPAS